MMARARLWTATLVAGLASGYAFAWSPTGASPDATPSSSQETAAQPGPSVWMARRVVDAAGAFERYVRTASAVNPEFDGAASVSGAVMASAAYDSRQLEQGAIAYAALVALQDPTFVDSLSRFEADPAGRAAYVQRLIATPDLVLEFEGASQAAAMAAAALNDMGATLVSRGRAVREAAYSMQRQPWALEPVAQPADRLSRVEQAGATQAQLSKSETNQLLTGIVRRRAGSADEAASAQPTPTVLRGLALAAAAVLGQAGENRAEALSPLMSAPDNAMCLRRAKQNLQQCLAAAGPQYEDVFCAGEHAIAETGQCIVRAAGGAVSDGVRVPVARTYARAGSGAVAVPVARRPGDAVGLDQSAQARPPADTGEEPSSSGEGQQSPGDGEWYSNEGQRSSGEGEWYSGEGRQQSSGEQQY